MKRRLKTLEQLKQIGWRDSGATGDVRPPDGFSDLMWVVSTMISRWALKVNSHFNEVTMKAHGKMKMGICGRLNVSCQMTLT